MSMKLLEYYFLRTVRLCADILTACVGSIYLSHKNYLPPLSNCLLLEPASELSKRIKNGKLKSEDLVKAYIERIQSVNPLINALIGNRFDAAIAEAREVDRLVALELAGQVPINGQSILQKPLLGIPVSIKECVSVKDMTFTAGLYSRKGTKAKRDARVVQNLRDAGAIPIGVTNVPEFLLWWDSNNKIYGRTNNPYDNSRISGGSSGGEGALISAAGSVVGVGTDLGGSIRIPSYFCGIFGHKPTPDIVPITETFPDVGHPDREKYLQIGPMCRYASDLKPMLTACAGNAAKHLKLDQKLDVKKLQIYYMLEDGDPFKTNVSEDIKQCIQRVTQFLDTQTGRPAEHKVLRNMKDSVWIWCCSLANVEAPYLGSELTERCGEVHGWSELAKCMIGRSQFRLSTTINVLLYNLYNPNQRRHTEKFQKYVTKGEELKLELNQLLGDNGVLIYPTLPFTAPKHNVTLLNTNNIGYTMIFNITGNPVTQVPLGLTKDGLPMGCQVVAAPYNDHLTIGVAELLEKEFGGWVPPFNIENSDTNNCKYDNCATNDNNALSTGIAAAPIALKAGQGLLGLYVMACHRAPPPHPIGCMYQISKGAKNHIKEITKDIIKNNNKVFRKTVSMLYKPLNDQNE
ncbi:fatty-acid amide hydrolase 2-like [Oppia nitens]|uniref:fatty-acid amide hydrolase 2-like n=1 Tax=Oppia nitens TaxID=1686743 RepID=UPI0023DC22D3|nr:fatty-acid amide hydrolase 2-like [Oppia nitens]